MMRVNELFYGEREPEFLVSTSAQQIIRDPKLFFDPTVKENAKPTPAKKDEKAKPIVLSASICCPSCVELIQYELFQVKGVKTVEGDYFKEKVTITGDAALADVIAAARKRFKHAQLIS